MSNTEYTAYAKLILEVFTHVAKEKVFSLKGGTAINLFVRNLPRLSVDIDLTYTGLEPREKAIKNAEASLARIKTEIEKYIPKAKVLNATKSDSENIEKLFVVQNGIQIKIEANPVIRGTAFDIEDRRRTTFLKRPKFRLYILHSKTSEKFLRTYLLFSFDPAFGSMRPSGYALRSCTRDNWMGKRLR